MDGEIGQTKSFFNSLIEHEKELFEFEGESEIADKFIRLDFSHEAVLHSPFELIQNEREFVSGVGHGRFLRRHEELLELGKNDDRVREHVPRSSAVSQSLALDEGHRILRDEGVQDTARKNLDEILEVTAGRRLRDPGVFWLREKVLRKLLPQLVAVEVIFMEKFVDEIKHRDLSRLFGIEATSLRTIY